MEQFVSYLLEDLKSIPLSIRLHKAFASQKKLGLLQKSDGGVEDTSDLLLGTHFPRSTSIMEVDVDCSNLLTATTLVNKTKFESTVKTFKLYKPSTRMA